MQRRGREHANGSAGVVGDVVVAQRPDDRTGAGLIPRLGIVRDHAVADRDHGRTEIVGAGGERLLVACEGATRNEDSCDACRRMYALVNGPVGFTGSRCATPGAISPTGYTS